MLAISSEDNSRLFDRAKTLTVEAFIPKFAMEALFVSILPGAAWLDIHWSGSLSGQPQAQFGSDELRSIVTSQETRRPSLLEQPGQYSDDGGGALASAPHCACNGKIGIVRQALQDGTALAGPRRNHLPFYNDPHAVPPFELPPGPTES